MKTISRMNEAITTTPSNIYSKREHVVSHKTSHCHLNIFWNTQSLSFNDICKHYNERKILTIVTFYKKTKSNKYTYKDIDWLLNIFWKSKYKSLIAHMYADNIMDKVLTILSFFPKKSIFNKYNDIVLLDQMFPPCFEVRFCIKNSNR